MDISNDIYISDTNNHKVRKITSSQIIKTVAGTGEAGYDNDNIRATSSKLNNPHSVAFDSFNNMFIADSSNNRVRKVSTTG